MLRASAPYEKNSGKFSRLTTKSENYSKKRRRLLLLCTGEATRDRDMAFALKDQAAVEVDRRLLTGRRFPTGRESEAKV